MLVPLTLPPGVYRNGTEYQSKGRWFDANLVRWFEGTLRPVGGWVPIYDTQTDEIPAPVICAGVPRAMIGWRAGETRDPWLAIGTNEALYAFSGGQLYDITPAALTGGGVNTEQAAGAFGIGAYGAQAYGTGDPAQGGEVEAATWQLDTFGAYLVGCMVGDGVLYVWDIEGVIESSGLASVMPDAPVDCVGIVVTPERFVVALGADGDGRLVQWADQESFTQWDPLVEGSQAGNYPLQGKGMLMCGRAGRAETLLWTDTSLWAMRYIGGTLVYGFERVGDDCGIIARNAVHVMGSLAVWMGPRKFFQYDGYVAEVPCDVSDAVFGDFNFAQRAKVVVIPRAEYGEITWHYPSALSTENDRYVTWNRKENHWTVGALERTCGIDRTPFQYPLAADADGAVYDHEREFDYAGDVPFAESGPVEAGEGDQIVEATEFIPDENNLGDTHVYLYSRFYPTGPERTYGPFTSARPTPIRVSGRQVRVRIEGVVANDWRVGVFRFDAEPGGRR